MNKIKNNAKGFKIFTKNTETFGAYLEMTKPIERKNFKFSDNF